MIFIGLGPQACSIFIIVACNHTHHFFYALGVRRVYAYLLARCRCRNDPITRHRTVGGLEEIYICKSRRTSRRAIYIHSKRCFHIGFCYQRCRRAFQFRIFLRIVGEFAHQIQPELAHMAFPGYQVTILLQALYCFSAE